jgi:hypothetical protein
VAGKGVFLMAKRGSKQKVKRPGAYKNMAEYILNQKIEKESGCWEWPTGWSKGYATLGVGGKKKKLHRVSYETFVGEIPEGMNVLHRCDNPLCIRPEHLFLGSFADNTRDGVKKGRIRSAFTEEEVVMIREAFKGGNQTINGYARALNVTRKTIREIVRGERWAGVGPDIRDIAEEIRTKGPAKLLEEEVEEIRRLLESGESQTAIANKFGVSRRSIYAIKEGETWVK